MNKAFTREPDGDDEEDNLPEPEESPAPNGKFYMTPAGFAALQQELRQLQKVERPKIVEIVSWAAGNGDRSENGDYIYGKKRLREIDRRLRYLLKRLDSAEVVDPARQQGLERVFFGATVTYAKADDTEVTVKLVGIDEADAAQGKISWQSPVAKALMKSQAGDTVTVRTPLGEEQLDIVSVHYEL